MYKNTPKIKNKAGKITALTLLICGAALFVLSNYNLIYPVWLAQAVGIILIAIAIYIASAFLLRQFTFAIEESNNDSSAANYEFVISERRSNRDTTVCRIGLDEIILAREITPQNKKAVMQERKGMEKFTYDNQFAPTRQIEIVAVIDGEKISVITTFDEQLLKILKENISLD